MKLRQKSVNPTILICLVSATLLGTSGCALFKSGQNPELEDPVARAAQQFRNPSSEMSAEEAMQSEHLHSVRENRDVALGMLMDDVISAWGQPGEVDTAGTPDSGNQRWTYQTGLAGRFSLQDHRRIVYFESGRVVGWESSK